MIRRDRRRRENSKKKGIRNTRDQDRNDNNDVE